MHPTLPDLLRTCLSLPETDQHLCQRLLAGQTPEQIAAEQKCPAAEIEQRIGLIRRQFEKQLLDSWLPRSSRMLLTAQEAAEVCGKSLRTWRTWDSAGHVPAAIRIGRSVFWRADELREWIEAGCPPREKWEVLKEE